MKLEQAITMVRLHKDCPEYLKDQLEIELLVKSYPPTWKQKTNNLSFRNVVGRAMGHPQVPDRIKTLLRTEAQFRRSK